jgi:hypothetical protein
MHLGRDGGPISGDMVLIVAIILSLFAPWPWNLLVVFGGVLAEVGEVIWGRQVRVHGELWEASCTVGADVGDMAIV